MSDAIGVEYWVSKPEGRLPTPAPAPAPETDGGGWIACSERMPEVGQIVEVITRGHYDGRYLTSYSEIATHWRPLPVDPHADAACLFSARYRPTVEQARTAARHVAGCAECRQRLEAKGGE